MAISFPTGGERQKFYVEGYIDSIRLLAQQTDSMLADTCVQETFRGNETKLDLYSSVSVVTRASLHLEVSVDAETGRQRRSVSPTFYEYSEYFDPRQDLLTQALLPDSQYRVNVMAAFYRQMDSLIIDSYLGNANIDGTNRVHDTTQDPGPGGATAGNKDNRVLNNSQTVNDGTGLTPDKIIEAVQKLRTSNVGERGEKLYTVVHPNQVKDILSATTNSGAEFDPRVVSSDYSTRMALEMGQPTYWMGCEWRVTTQIAAVTNDFKDTSTDGRYAYVKSEEAVACFKAPSGMTVTLDRVPERGGSMLLFHQMPMAALRTEGKKVCPIECEE